MFHGTRLLLAIGLLSLTGCAESDVGCSWDDAQIKFHDEAAESLSSTWSELVNPQSPIAGRYGSFDLVESGLLSTGVWSGPICTFFTSSADSDSTGEGTAGVLLEGSVDVFSSRAGLTEGVLSYSLLSQDHGLAIEYKKESPLARRVELSDPFNQMYCLSWQNGPCREWDYLVISDTCRSFTIELRLAGPGVTPDPDEAIETLEPIAKELANQLDQRLASSGCDAYDGEPKPVDWDV